MCKVIKLFCCCFSSKYQAIAEQEISQSLHELPISFKPIINENPTNTSIISEIPQPYFILIYPINKPTIHF